MGIVFGALAWILLYKIITGIWKTAFQEKYEKEEENLPAEEWYY